MSEARPESCPACGERAKRAARFCARCGAELEATRARVRRERELSDAKRTVTAIGIVFLGTLLSLLGVGVLAGEHPAGPALQTSSLALVAFAAARTLGPGGLRASLARGTGAGGLALGLAGGGLCFALNWAYVAAFRSLAGAEPEPGPEDSLVWLLLTVAVLPALIEEWLCRGVLWSACRRATGTPLTLVVTALLFALLHGLGGGGTFELPHRFATGLVLGLLRAHTQSLVPGIVAHFVNNALAVASE